MGQFILAVHAGHNASVCIGDESGLIYAVQEERLNGEKNYWAYPKLAVEDCMKQVGAKQKDIRAIAHGSNYVLCRYHSREDVMNSYSRQMTKTGLIRQQIAMPLMLALRPTFGRDQFEKHIKESGFNDVPISYYDHHLTHGTTAYYGLRDNPKEKYLVLTCDGVGDFVCASVRVMGGGEIKEYAVTPWENSLGAIYSWITYLMGFVPLEHEYKLMGMAPYASEKAAIETAKIFHSYLGLSENGLSFKRKMLRRTNDIHARMISDLQGKRFDYICAGLQRFTEDILCEWAANAVKATGVRKILASGGVFMNVKANKKIAEMAEVESFEAFPSCGDETLPLGAFWMEAAKQFGDESVPPLKNFYLGGEDTAEEIEDAVKNSGFEFEKPANVADRVAELLTKGEPVARCSGRMEFGARALGNRSILADPSNQDVVRVINQMVKKRDFWMPFAPMIMEERQHEYIENPKNLRSPYMMMTFDARENFREFIAAVHNADLTCRAQILSREQNPGMYEIFKAFEKRTGRGVILNTSFNLHGFPIVRTAKDALHVLRESGLRYLQVGDWIVRKPN